MSAKYFVMSKNPIYKDKKMKRKKGMGSKTAIAIGIGGLLLLTVVALTAITGLWPERDRIL